MPPVVPCNIIVCVHFCYVYIFFFFFKNGIAKFGGMAGDISISSLNFVCLLTRVILKGNCV